MNYGLYGTYGWDMGDESDVICEFPIDKPTSFTGEAVGPDRASSSNTMVFHKGMGFHNQHGDFNKDLTSKYEWSFHDP